MQSIYIPKSPKNVYCLDGLLGTDELAGVELFPLEYISELGLFKEKLGDIEKSVFS